MLSVSAQTAQAQALVVWRDWSGRCRKLLSGPLLALAVVPMICTTACSWEWIVYPLTGRASLLTLTSVSRCTRWVCCAPCVCWRGPCQISRTWKHAFSVTRPRKRTNFENTWCAPESTPIFSHRKSAWWCMELWLISARNQTSMFQKTVISATEDASRIATPNKVLVAIKEEHFVTWNVKCCLQELVQACNIQENFFKVGCDYSWSMHRIPWEIESYGSTANMKWPLLRKMAEWQEIQSNLKEFLSFPVLMTKEDF